MSDSRLLQDINEASLSEMPPQPESSDPHVDKFFQFIAEPKDEPLETIKAFFDAMIEEKGKDYFQTLINRLINAKLSKESPAEFINLEVDALLCACLNGASNKIQALIEYGAKLGDLAVYTFDLAVEHGLFLFAKKIIEVGLYKMEPVIKILSGAPDKDKLWKMSLNFTCMEILLFTPNKLSHQQKLELLSCLLDKGNDLNRNVSAEAGCEVYILDLASNFCEPDMIQWLESKGAKKRNEDGEQFFRKRLIYNAYEDCNPQQSHMFFFAEENTSFMITLSQEDNDSIIQQSVAQFAKQYGVAHLNVVMAAHKSIQLHDESRQLLDCTLLEYFCEAKPNVIRALLENGMSISAFEQLDSLKVAIEKGWAETAEYLIQYGYDLRKAKKVSIHIGSKETNAYVCDFLPIEMTIHSKNLTVKQKEKLIDLLISKGSNLNRNMVAGGGKMHINAYYLASVLGQKKLLGYLEKKGAMKMEVRVVSDLNGENRAEAMRANTKSRYMIRDFLKKETSLLSMIEALSPSKMPENKLVNLICSYELDEERLSIKLNKNHFFYEEMKKGFPWQIQCSSTLLSDQTTDTFSFSLNTYATQINSFFDYTKTYLKQLEAIYQARKAEEQKKKEVEAQKKNNAEKSDSKEKNQKQAKSPSFISDLEKKDKSTEEKSDQAYYESRSEKTSTKNKIPSKPKKKKINGKNKKKIKNKKPKLSVNNANSSAGSESEKASPLATVNANREIPKAAPLEATDFFAADVIREKLLTHPHFELNFFAKSNQIPVGENTQAMPSTTASPYVLQSTTPQSILCIYPGADHLQSFAFSDAFKNNQKNLSQLMDLNQASNSISTSQFHCQVYYSLFQLVEYVLQLWDGHDSLHALMPRELLSNMRECLKPDYVFSLENEALTAFHACIQGFKSDLLSILTQIQDAYSGKIQRLDFFLFQFKNEKDIQFHYEDKQVKMQQNQLEKNADNDPMNGYGLFSGVGQMISDAYKKSTRLEIASIYIRFEACQYQSKYCADSSFEKLTLIQEMKYLIVAMACLANRIYKKTDADLLPLITTANTLRHVTEEARSSQIRDLKQDDAIFEPQAMQSSGLTRSLQILKERISHAIQQIQTASSEKNRMPGKKQ